ncbi:hypothetical protein SLA2020_233520 [Shorea laevis]
MNNKNESNLETEVSNPKVPTLRLPQMKFRSRKRIQVISMTRKRRLRFRRRRWFKWLAGGGKIEWERSWSSRRSLDVNGILLLLLSVQTRGKFDLEGSIKTVESSEGKCGMGCKWHSSCHASFFIQSSILSA